MLGWGNLNKQNFSADEDFDPETGEILDTNTARETLASTTAADPAGEADDASSADQSEMHGSSSINGEPSSSAAPQGEADHSQGTGAETLAGREERNEGQAASADLPTNSEPVEGEQGEMPRTAAAPVAEGVSHNASSVTPFLAITAGGRVIRHQGEVA